MDQYPVDVLTLEASREGNDLKISAHERIKGETSTIRHYEKVEISADSVNARCLELIDTLNKANRRGRMTQELLVMLREIGQIFHDEFFTPVIKEKLRKTRAEYLRLYLDDRLVHIPWELVHDGQQFLCQRFNMGRLVKTSQPVSEIQSRTLTCPLKLLILADPEGNLKGAYEEGTQLRDDLDQKRDLINVSLQSGNITEDVLKRKVRNFDVIHFAGHAEYDPENPEKSGWKLSNGSLKSVDITKMAGTAAMPTLVFSNACQSARTGEWALSENFQNEIFGLANAFLLAGVNHYIGTFWEILDEPSKRFAVEFYKNAFSDMTVGESVRQARSALIREYGEETIVWASYLLYGDPTLNYIEQIRGQEPAEKTKRAQTAGTDGEPRGHGNVIKFGSREEPKKPRSWRAVVGTALVAVVLFGAYFGFLGKGTGKHEQEALAFYETGDYPKAVEACRLLIEKDPARSIIHVILGNIHFREGNLGRAHQDFLKALEAGDGSDMERADALIGLGRIASIENKDDEALQFYQEASRLVPGKWQTYVSQGLLFDKQGKYDQAMKLFGKASTLSPDERSIVAIFGETRKKAAFFRSREKQERIDKLVQDLLKNFDKPTSSVPSDGWTSMPLTLWTMDFKTQGYSLLEGEGQLVVSCILDQLIEKSRVQVVERVLLDKLLEELKLGTSKLADPGTATSLGKIMAAKVILSGRIVYSGPQTQIAMRLIETETGQVTAAVNETFSAPVPPSVMAEKLSSILLSKFKTLYPLRGKISEIKENQIVLNIGKRHGIRSGQQFKVVGTDWVMEVNVVQTNKSTAKVRQADGELRSGLRVEAI